MAKPQVPETNLLEMPKHLPDLSLTNEEPDRLVYGKVEYLGDVLATHLHLENVPGVAPTSTPVTRYGNVRHEDHLDFDPSGALALLTASALDIEAEVSRAKPLLSRDPLHREHLPDLIPRLDVRDRIRTRGTANR